MYMMSLERQALECVETLDKAVYVACSILSRMNGSKEHEVTMICGPMSTGGLGSLKENMCHFKKAICVAKQHGLLVFDQTFFQETITRITRFQEGVDYDPDILEVFYRGVFESRHIGKALFLPDWETSRGAVWERQMAPEFDILVGEYPKEWLALL